MKSQIKINSQFFSIEFPKEFSDTEFIAKNLEKDLKKVSTFSKADIDYIHADKTTYQRLLEMEKCFLQNVFLAKNRIFSSCLKFKKETFIKRLSFTTSTLYYQKILRKFVEFLENQYKLIDLTATSAQSKKDVEHMQALVEVLADLLKKNAKKIEDCDNLMEENIALRKTIERLRNSVGETVQSNIADITGSKVRPSINSKVYSFPEGSDAKTYR